MGKNMPSIGKYQDTIYDIKRQTYYVETLEDGTVITDETRELPTIDFVCSTKLHGTFAGVKYDRSTGALTALSKSDKISIGSDNAGFAQFVENHKEYFIFYLKELADSLDLDLVQISGEWVGKGIQKGVGINKIKNRTFVMFGIKFKQENQNPRWAQMPQEILRQISDKDFNIRSIFEFDHPSVTIDFNHPEKALVQLDKLKDDIEKRCPVSEEMLMAEKYENLIDTELIGEGFVGAGFLPNGDRFIFKHKGEKHSTSSKNKQPKEVDPLEEEKRLFAEKVTPTWRLEQSITETNAETMKEMGAVIKWVISDVIKEEQAEFRESAFTIKDLNKFISNIVRDWYKKYLEDEALR